MKMEEYNFLKNERVPQWMIISEVAFFGADVKVVAHKHKTVVSGICGKDNALIEIRNKNGESATQVCPQIHFIIENNVDPFSYKTLEKNSSSNLFRMWNHSEEKITNIKNNA